MHDPVLEDKLPFCSHSVHLREVGEGEGEREGEGEGEGEGERGREGEGEGEGDGERGRDGRKEGAREGRGGVRERDGQNIKKQKQTHPC